MKTSRSTDSAFEASEAIKEDDFLVIDHFKPPQFHPFAQCSQATNYPNTPKTLFISR